MKNLIKKLIDSCKKNLRDESGMSLIELIVAMVIVAMLLGVSTMYLPTYRDQQMLRQAALDVNDSLRLAQTKALTTESGNANWYSWSVESDSSTVCSAQTGRKSIVIQSDAPNSSPLCVGFDEKDHGKVQITPEGLSLYFQTKTGRIFSSDKTTRANTNIEIKHINMQSTGSNAYRLSINNDSIGYQAAKVGDRQY